MPYRIILHPYVTEKTMAEMEKHNRIQFIVSKKANKKQIAWAFEKIFEVKVANVNTLNRKEGKLAMITLKPEYSAEEIGMRIGIF